MFDFLLKQALSLAISITTLFVPQDKWQEKLDNIPAQEERIAGRDLTGWEFRRIISTHTGQEYTYYYYSEPSSENTAGSTTPGSMVAKKTLLLLHGFNTDGAVYFNLKPLADTYALVAFNFPEKSGLYTGSIRDFEILLDDFCDELCFDTLTLVGNSLGGIIAGFYTAQTQKVVIDNLVIISSYLHGGTRRNVRSIRKMADKLLPYPDYKLFYLLSLGSRVSDRIGKGKGAADAPVDAIVIKHIDWYRQILKSLYWYDGPAYARRITCPVTILHGEKDRLVDFNEAAVTKKYIPQAKVKVFDDAGHSLIYSHADECIAFLRKNL